VELEAAARAAPAAVVCRFQSQAVAAALTLLPGVVPVAPLCPVVYLLLMLLQPEVFPAAG